MVPCVDVAGLKRAIARALQADVPLHIEGAPGTGKTEIVGAIARDLGVDLAYLELAGADPADVPGIPVPDHANAQIARWPIGPIRRACAGPVILFLDEWSQASPAQHGAALTLINERRAGDFRLHHGTRIILGSNPPENGANASEIPLPAINRVITIRFSPSMADVCAYLDTLGAPGSTLRSLGIDYSATLDVAPNLFQASPPGPNGTWASARAIVRGLNILATCIDAGDDLDADPVPGILFAGAVGAEVGPAYMAIRKIRKDLPSRADIEKDPGMTKLPMDLNAGIACMGVIAQVAESAPNAAWIYAERLDAEIRGALYRRLAARPPRPGALYQGALRAQAKIGGAIGARLGGI